MKLTDKQRLVYAQLDEPMTARKLSAKIMEKQFRDELGGAWWFYDRVHSMLVTLEKKGAVVRDAKVREHYALGPQHLWRRV